MKFSDMRNAADPYVEILEDGFVKIRGEALVELDDCMDDSDFGNVIRFSLMVALLSVESGVRGRVRIGETATESVSELDYAVPGIETAE